MGDLDGRGDRARAPARGKEHNGLEEHLARIVRAGVPRARRAECPLTACVPAAVCYPALAGGGCLGGPSLSHACLPAWRLTLP